MKSSQTATQGVESGETGFSSFKPTEILNTPISVDQEKAPWLIDKAKEFGSILYVLTEKTEFVAIFTSVIGFIVMSSFGGLKSAEEFWRYILFLVIVYGAHVCYRIVKTQNSSFKKSWSKKFSNREGVIAGLLAIVSLLLILSNWKFLIWVGQGMIVFLKIRV